MPLTLYTDVHVPAAITSGLRRREIDVLTSQEDGTRRAADEALLERATQLGRILFSQDADLLEIAQAWQATGREFSGVFFAHQEGASIGRLIEHIELLLTCTSPEELANTVTYLPLK